MTIFGNCLWGKDEKILWKDQEPIFWTLGSWWIWRYPIFGQTNRILSCFNRRVDGRCLRMSCKGKGHVSLEQQTVADDWIIETEQKLRSFNLWILRHPSTNGSMDQHRSNPTPPGTTLPPLQARKYLGRFGLHGDLALQPVKFLSGGQKSRLAFAELAWWGGPREAQGRPKGGPRPKAQGPRKLKGQQGKRPNFFSKFKAQSQSIRKCLSVQRCSMALRPKNPDLATDKELTSHHASGWTDAWNLDLGTDPAQEQHIFPHHVCSNGKRLRILSGTIWTSKPLRASQWHWISSRRGQVRTSKIATFGCSTQSPRILVAYSGLHQTYRFVAATWWARQGGVVLVSHDDRLAEPSQRWVVSSSLVDGFKRFFFSAIEMAWRSLVTKMFFSGSTTNQLWVHVSASQVSMVADELWVVTPGPSKDTNRSLECDLGYLWVKLRS